MNFFESELKKIMGDSAILDIKKLSCLIKRIVFNNVFYFVL